MIIVLDWQQFRLRFYNSNHTIYVREDDLTWAFLTMNDGMPVKAVVEKYGNVEDNIMFVQRWLDPAFTNIIRVLDIQEDIPINADDTSTEVQETKYSEEPESEPVSPDTDEGGTLEKVEDER